MPDLAWLTARPIAHRGLHDSNRTRWENTRAAFQAAIDHGFAIECDVHLTADRVPVVFHDPDLSRLTGRQGQVWQHTAAELAEFAIGGTEERIPSLADVLSLVAGQVPIIIELKWIPGQDHGLVEQTVRCLEGYPGPAAMMSFDHYLVRDMALHAGDIPYGLTAEGMETTEIETHFTMLAHGISFVSYAVKHLPNPFVTFVREKLAMPVITWTVRDEAAARATLEHADQMTFEGFVPGVKL
jgi:glycerophosphoryl diester phosphodiesterase